SGTGVPGAHVGRDEDGLEIRPTPQGTPASRRWAGCCFKVGSGPRPNADGLDAAAEEIRNLGYAVIDSGFSADQLRLIRAKSDAIDARQVQECGEGNL